MIPTTNIDNIAVEVLGGSRHALAYVYRSTNQRLAEAVTLKNASVALQLKNATGQYPAHPWSHGMTEREMVHCLLLEGWVGPQPVNLWAW